MMYIFYDVWIECKVPTLTYHRDKNHESKTALKDELSEPLYIVLI